MSDHKKHYELKLDPRTKLLLLLIANIVAFAQRSPVIEISWVAFLTVLIAVCGCKKPAVKWAFLFSFLLVLQYYVFPNAPKIVVTTCYILVAYARKIFPCLIVGTLLIKKTSVRELMLSLRKWHVPQGLIIPLSVTIRYFPAIKEEIHYIKDAMKLRNIHGIQKLECLVVPIMISATNTAEELSAAAVTRGIENPAPKTSMITMKIGAMDVLCVCIGILFVLAALFFR